MGQARRLNHDYDWFYHRQRLWKNSHGGEKEISFRGNKKWCERYGHTPLSTVWWLRKETI